MELQDSKMQKGKFVLYHSKQKKGNAVYIYYMIAWYFRENNKPVRNIIKHLGRLDEYEIEFYKNSIACLNEDHEVFPCNINKLFVRNSNEYLSCAIGIHFWDYWNLSTVFKDNSGQKEVQTSDVAKILTVLRLIESCSKSFTTKLYQETCLPQLTGVSASVYNNARIFRELDDIEHYREALGKHIFNFAKDKGYTQGEVLFYDLSSGNISGLRCVMAKWGHCKDGFNTHVVLLLVITPEGYPVYWELLEGNTADAKTIERLILKIENIYGKVESVLCFDRGMVSDDNLKLLEGKKIRFITALDGDQIHYFKEFIDFALIEKVKGLDLKKNSNEIRENLTRCGFNFVRDDLFYKEIQFLADQKMMIEKITKKLNLYERRYFLAFNPELAYLAQRHRKRRVEEYREWIREYNEELSQALADRKKETIDKSIKDEMRRRKIADVEINYTLTEYVVENKNDKGKIKRAISYKITLGEVTEKSYEKAKKYDGLWVLITNISSGEDKKFFDKTKFTSYFEIYRLKNTIEEAFKILSSFVGIEPFYVYTTKHIQAHFTICVLSYLIDITILNRIRKSDEIDNMDLHNLFHILKKCKQDVIQLDERKVVSKITQVTEKQKKLLDILDCAYLVSPEHLVERNIISIENL